MGRHNHWNLDDMPSQAGRVAIVTGANSGIGYEAAKALAHKGARVILACRSRERGEAALASIRAGSPSGTVELELLDLGDLSSVRAFAERLPQTAPRFDLLILNAGVMVPPASTTSDGFEMQLGVNHLGHFALTGLLLESLEAAPGARIVVVSSLAHKMGSIHFDDLHFTRGYRAWPAYGQSKLANLLFLDELNRRLQAAGSPIVATAAHPGWTRTELQRNSLSARVFGPLLAMETARGALPTLRAALDPDAEAGAYFGPDGPFEVRGAPAPASRTRKSRDRDTARRLWEVSEQLTGVHYLADGGASASAAA
ncbi:MAG: SDR family oxidoreductase [Deltaproteobacteria bacterium]|nr:SDR family oxidoreductase [Deltaproteobacteria bacterium]